MEICSSMLIAAKSADILVFLSEHAEMSSIKAAFFFYSLVSLLIYELQSKNNSLV